MALLDHPATSLRKHAAEALTELGDPAGLEAAAALIDDPKLAEAGIAAAWRLPPGPRFERLAPLVQGLSAPKKNQQRAPHLLALFEQEAHKIKPRTDWDPRWADALRPHLDGPRREAVAVALAVVLGAGAVPDLLRVLDASARKGELGVIQALGRLGAREAAGPLIELINTRTVQDYHLFDALNRTCDASAIPALQAKLAGAKPGWTRTRIEYLIAELAARSPA